jgi:hypothetical protein
VERELGVSETEGFLRNGHGDAGEFKKDRTWFDHRDVKFDRALSLTHSNLGRLLRHWFMRENANPKLTFAFQVARDGNAGSFDLLTGHWAAGERLEAEFAEG